MADIRIIIEFLDSHIEANNLKALTPPEANYLLKREGLLEDSSTRKGKPLRNLLREKLLPHAFYVGRYWYIPHSI